MVLGALLIAIAAMPVQDPQPGISRELARDRRARVSGVSYELRFDLFEDADAAPGELLLKFALPDDDPLAAPLVLDFGGATLDELRVNGRRLATPPLWNADHVLLPSDALAQGLNLVEARFSARIAVTGEPLTRYRDPSDGSSYLYTLSVPADAHRMFPCFDQPDLKARFELSLFVPGGWTAVANAEATNDPARNRFAEVSREQPGGRSAFTFAWTEPLPTYLFAFAAGPFRTLADPAPSGVGENPSRGIRLLVRSSKAPHVDEAAVFGMHRRALGWLGRWFDFPYPFDKLDLVLLPGFPYGGMEHAGAIFYRESALVFERAPTETEQLRRSTLVYHEVAHQWFGNLVTMEWFDDLWLKEGFATFLGYTLVEELEPGRRAWLRFHQRVKPRAYEVDATAGTTPIYQELGNLADAKSAYGAIVYNKAPAVLRELQERLGADDFRRGVRLFVQRHAFGNATWRDLVDALVEAAGLRGSRWSDRWILGRGLPRVRASWEAGPDGDIAVFAIEQRDAVGSGSNEPWPLSLEVLLIAPDGRTRTVSVLADNARTEVGSLVGQPVPAAVLLNPSDVAYGLFTLDERSREHLVESLASLEDPMTRAVAVSALEQTTDDGELDPRRFHDVVADLVAEERDPETHDWLLDKLGVTLERWLPPGSDRDQRRTRLEELLRTQLAEGRSGTALQTFRFLGRHGRTAETLDLLRGVLDGARRVAGLELEARDRFLAAAALLASGDGAAVAREQRRAGDGADVAKWAYLAGAAAADAATKERWFASYEQLDEPPEQWMQESLAYFHWPGQGELTLPYLRRALDRVAWVKANRKIFFMPAWIDGFVNGHASVAALEIVEAFLDERGDLAPDIRRKILQSLDRLQRTVRIRARWGS